MSIPTKHEVIGSKYFTKDGFVEVKDFNYRFTMIGVIVSAINGYLELDNKDIAKKLQKGDVVEIDGSFIRTPYGSTPFSFF